MPSWASRLSHVPPFLSAAGLGGSADVPGKKKQEPIWTLMRTAKAAHGLSVLLDNSPCARILGRRGPWRGPAAPALTAHSRADGQAQGRHLSPWEALGWGGTQAGAPSVASWREERWGGAQESAMSQPLLP